MTNKDRHCEERVLDATRPKGKIATKQSKLPPHRLLRRCLAAGAGYVLCTLLAMTMMTRQATAQQTETLMLSGTGSDKTMNWEFFCTAGRNAGKWTTIPVPSNWEQHGFGGYNYGHDKDSVRHREKGLYKYRFTVPDAWKNKSVQIVFEGSMTDTEVKINGRSAGEIHMGS